MHINFHELIWAIVNFSVLLAVLYKFLYGPIMKTLESRQTEISNNLSNAENARKDAEELRLQLNQERESAKREAQEIVAKATKMGDEVKNDIITQARDEAVKTSQKAQEEIQREKEQALSDIRDEVGNLALVVAGKVVGKSMSQKEHQQLVDKYITEVGEVQ